MTALSEAMESPEVQAALRHIEEVRAEARDAALEEAAVLCKSKSDRWASLKPESDWDRAALAGADCAEGIRALKSRRT